MISTGVSNVNLALVLAPLTFLPMMLVGGFFANEDSLPDYISWFQYLSILKYAYEIMIINEFDGLEFTCDSSPQGNSTTRCIHKGEDVIKLLSMEDSNIAENLAILVAFFLAMNIVAFTFLKFVVHRH